AANAVTFAGRDCRKLSGRNNNPGDGRSAAAAMALSSSASLRTGASVISNAIDDWTAFAVGRKNRAIDAVSGLNTADADLVSGATTLISSIHLHLMLRSSVPNPVIEHPGGV